jgi:hypothetical protein
MFLIRNQNLLILYWKTRNQLWSSIQGTTTQILAWHYLHCFALHFPFGHGGIEEDRRTHVSTEECLKHYLKILLPRFQHADIILVISHMYFRKKRRAPPTTAYNLFCGRQQVCWWLLSHGNQLLWRWEYQGLLLFRGVLYVWLSMSLLANHTQMVRRYCRIIVGCCL